MGQTGRFPIIQSLYQERFLLLLSMLLVYIGGAPLLKDWIALRQMMDLLFSAVFLSAILAVSQTRLQTVLAVVLALPMFFNAGVLNVMGRHQWDAISHAFSILFLLFVMVLILRFVFETPRVTRNTISAAVVVYLLIGVTWSVIFLWMENRVPGSFNLGSTSPTEGTYIFIYYSFVTLTTLGYGDISPLTNPARAMVILEAVIGQLYLAVLIARLVGAYIADRKA